jgi:hypothetical protein
MSSDDSPVRQQSPGGRHSSQSRDSKSGYKGWGTREQSESVKKNKGDVDSDLSNSRMDRWTYLLESGTAVYASFQFWMVLVITIVGVILFAVLWRGTTDYIDYTTKKPMTIPSAIDFVTQIIVSGGYDNSLTTSTEQLLFTLMLIFGFVIFAILIGFITDTVTSFMTDMKEGKTKVVESGHTLIIGWNESTPRVITQIAFIRRAWQVQNETLARRLCPALRVKPETPVAAAPIVILADNYTKPEMDAMVRTTFAERGINPKRTCVGSGACDQPRPRRLNWRSR